MPRGRIRLLPRRDLVRLLAIESHRHAPSLIGEDLGTVRRSSRRCKKAGSADGCAVVQRRGQHDTCPPSKWSRRCRRHEGQRHDLRPGAAGGGQDRRIVALLWDALSTPGFAADAALQRRFAAPACRTRAVLFVAETTYALGSSHWTNRGHPDRHRPRNARRTSDTGGTLRSSSRPCCSDSQSLRDG